LQSLFAENKLKKTAAVAMPKCQQISKMV